MFYNYKQKDQIVKLMICQIELVIVLMFVFSVQSEEMLNQGYVRSNSTFKIGFPSSFMDKMRESQRPITLKSFCT